MLKQVELNNFFSYKEDTIINLNPGVNLLLGINGSGKTSFINALRLLYEGVCGAGFESCFQTEWGGFHDVVNANGGKTLDCIKLTFVFNYKTLKRLVHNSPFKSDVYYTIIVHPTGKTSYTLEEKLYSNDNREADKQFVYLYFKNEKGFLSVYHHDGIKNERFAGDTSGQELILRQISDPRRYLPLHTIKTAISQMALYDSFDTGSQSEIRKPVISSSELRVCPDGSNVASVLNNMTTEDIPTYQLIENTLITVNRNFQKFAFQIFGSRIYLSLIEKNLSHSIGMKFVSDGTLRYMLMMSILLNKNTGALIALDEPEGRLHPDMIHSVAEMLRRSARSSQVIIATHSPLLLNDFELEDIIVFEKNEENCTIVKRFYEEDFEDYEGNMLPGSLWLDGQIGGKRW